MPLEAEAIGAVTTEQKWYYDFRNTVHYDKIFLNYV